MKFKIFQILFSQTMTDCKQSLQ